MSTTAPTATQTAYAPPSAGTTLLTECLLSTIAGLPLPEAVRPPAAVTRRFPTARDGAEWILRGPSA